jgi:hypothetical protein
MIVEGLAMLFVLNVLFGDKFGYIPSFGGSVLKAIATICAGVLIGCVAAAWRGRESRAPTASLGLGAIVLLAFDGLPTWLGMFIVLVATALFVVVLDGLKRPPHGQTPNPEKEGIRDAIRPGGAVLYGVLGWTGALGPAETYLWLGIGAFALFLHELPARQGGATAVAPTWLQLAALLVATRLALTAIGVCARSVILNAEHQAHSFTGNAWLDLWGQWDTGWLVSIARGGYSANLTAHGSANYGFFPLFPALMQGGAWLVGSHFVAGLIVSNASLIAAGVLLYKLARLDSDEREARRAVLFLLLFPLAFLLSAVLTESLYLALALGALYFARKESWLMAAGLGFFTALTRYIGVLLVIPLAWEYLRSRDFRLSRVRPDCLWLALVPLGLLVFMFLCYQLTGDWFAYLKVKISGWSHRVTEPGSLMTISINGGTEAQMQGWIAVVSLAVLLSGAGRIRTSSWIFGLYSLVVPLFGGLVYGFPRHAAVCFPLFLILARLGSRQDADPWLAPLMLVLQGGLMVLWGLGLQVIIQAGTRCLAC